jgi:hypothetical protein
MKRSVLQDWVQGLTMMQQTVLLTAIRGPDGTPKYGSVKMLLRWFRRCVLLSAIDGKVLDNPCDSNGGSFTGPSLDDEDDDCLDPWQDRMQTPCERVPARTGCDPASLPASLSARRRNRRLQTPGRHHRYVVAATLRAARA